MASDKRDLIWGSCVSDHSSDDLRPNACVDRDGEWQEEEGQVQCEEGRAPVPRSEEENTGVCRRQLLFTRTITEQQTMGFSVAEYTGNECARKGVRTRNSFITVKSEGWRKGYNEQRKYTGVNNCSWTPPTATPPCAFNANHRSAMATCQNNIMGLSEKMSTSEKFSGWSLF